MEPATETDNRYFQRICPSDGEVAFTMSGRCGIYHCLRDILRRDTRKVAYLPRYTCETVAAPFHKAGYALRFYDLDENLRSVFDPAALGEISVLSLCGYYGFCNYDRDFVRACRDRGIVIFEDVTHSLLSAGGIDPLCDYAAGSFRKWMGVPCGGFAMKRHGAFAGACLPPDSRHLELRRQAIAGQDSDVFWEGEMLLRKIFGDFGSDAESEYLLCHADLTGICAARRRNYAALLDALPQRLSGIRPVFPELTDGAVPSHFCVYCDDRPRLQEYLRQREIGSTVYWPVGPLIDLTGHDTVRYIYNHILSLPCDQRYQPADMHRIARALADFCEE